MLLLLFLYSDFLQGQQGPIFITKDELQRLKTVYLNQKKLVIKLEKSIKNLKLEINGLKKTSMGYSKNQKISERNTIELLKKIDNISIKLQREQEKSAAAQKKLMDISRDLKKQTNKQLKSSRKLRVGNKNKIIIFSIISFIVGFFTGIALTKI